MLSLLVFALFLVVRADPTPTAPAPGAVFNEGTNCMVQWNADTSGAATWKTMNIQLMTGDNYNMVALSTVATVDGTDPTKNVFTYPCLKVTPHSAIYFYQFSSPNSPNLYWTGRFVLAGPNGESVPPEHQTQPGTNANIPWGTGMLVNPSQASPPPTIGGSGIASASGSLPGAPSSSATGSALSTSISAGPTSVPSSSSGFQTSTPGSTPAPSIVPGTPATDANASATSSGAASGKTFANNGALTALFAFLIASLS